MKTVQEVANEIIKDHPELYTILTSGCGNISALARKIQPEIEKRLLKKINLITIVVSLKRIQTKKPLSKKIFSTPPDISLRTNLCEIILPLHRINLKTIKKILNNYFSNDYNMIFTKGSFEITLILPNSVLELFIKEIGKENIKKIITDLNIISINLPKNVIDIPGVYYRLLSIFNAHQIPFVEIFSTYTEVSFVVKEEYLLKTIKLMRKLTKLL